MAKESGEFRKETGSDLPEKSKREREEISSTRGEREEKRKGGVILKYSEPLEDKKVLLGAQWERLEILQEKRKKGQQGCVKIAAENGVFAHSKKGGCGEFPDAVQKDYRSGGIPDKSGHFSSARKGKRADRGSDPYGLFSWIDEDRSGNFVTQ